MMGLFMWRSCGLGFLALHKLQFSVEFCIYTSFSICCSVLARALMISDNDSLCTRSIPGYKLEGFGLLVCFPKL
jgi:hypothetical protein